MIILNLKNYPESTGKNLDGVINDVAGAISQHPELAEFLVVAPAIYDLHLALDTSTPAPVTIAAPHVDPIGPGSTTGMVPALNIVSLGIKYAVLNHSEHRVGWVNIENTIKSAHAAGLKMIVCCENLEEAKALLPLKPFAIAYEDKELIGSGKSIVTGKPDDVKAFIALSKGKTKVIIGAGISTGEDVKAGIAMGAEGFILASAFVKATDRKAKAIELASPFIKSV